jgi:hypothetical protein
MTAKQRENCIKVKTALEDIYDNGNLNRYSLKPYEAKLLKQALFTLATIRSKSLPNIKFDFKSPDDPEIKNWIEKN